MYKTLPRTPGLKPLLLVPLANGALHFPRDNQRKSAELVLDANVHGTQFVTL